MSKETIGSWDCEAEINTIKKQCSELKDNYDQLKYEHDKLKKAHAVFQSAVWAALDRGTALLD